MLYGVAARSRARLPGIPGLVSTRNAALRASFASRARKELEKEKRERLSTAQQNGVLEDRTSLLWRTQRFLVSALGVFFGVHLFFEHVCDFAPSTGISMLPTINSFGDWLITSKLWYRRGRGITVGDVVCYSHPIKMQGTAVKRVIGMPGDFVLQQTPGLGDGRMIQVPQGHCWVAGDNLGQSRDSRHHGPVPLALVVGKVVGRASFGKWGIPKYERLADSSDLVVVDDSNDRG